MFVAETTVSSPSHGEPATSTRDDFSSWYAPNSSFWNSFSQPSRGDLGREQNIRRKGKQEV